MPRAYAGLWARVLAFAVVTLCLVPEGESPAALAQARRFYEALRAPKRFEVRSVADGANSHCGLSNIAYTAAIVYDWLLDIFTSSATGGGH
jgi:hypothetical protein